MLLKFPAREGKILSWLIVAVWTIFIFATIPFARTIQLEIQKLLGSRTYMTAAGIMGLFFSIVLLIYAFRRRTHKAISRFWWLLFLTAGSIFLLRFQLQSPAEAIHFFEYSILSFFLFRAWSHHVQDRLIYANATLTLIIIASTDEFLQWLMPGRYWDIRDIRLNVLAGLLIQAFIGQVIQPSGIRDAVDRRSVRLFCRLAWITLVILGLAFANTPSRVDLYSTRIPFLQFLSNNESVMSEYGFKHHDPDIGTFYSRFTMRDLQNTDRKRGAEVGETILKYQSLLDYKELIQKFNTLADPFLHEMRVHVYRRDHYYDTAWQYQNKDPSRFVYNMTVAYRENQLLEKYFPFALVTSKKVLPGKVYQQVLAHADRSSAYTSVVSDHLVTVATESEFRFAILFLAILVGIVYARYGRERKVPVE